MTRPGQAGFMKLNKGITLISVSIYVIGAIMAVGIVAMLTSFFYTNVINAKSIGQAQVQYSKFNMFFLEDLKESDSFTLSEPYSGYHRQIAFSSGAVYTFNAGTIYRDRVKICEKILDCGFKSIDDGERIEVFLRVGEEETPGEHALRQIYKLGRGY